MTLGGTTPLRDGTFRVFFADLWDETVDLAAILNDFVGVVGPLGSLDL